MGFRFRKSFNLGAGFRVNLSKSGVGYSFGGKGFRVAKKSTGGTRKTISIPGTGISYVSESSNKKTHNSSADNTSGTTSHENNYYSDEFIENAKAETMMPSGLESVLDKASQSLKMNKLCNWGIALSIIIGFSYPILWIASVCFIIWKHHIKTNGLVELQYEINEEIQSTIDGILTPLINITKSERVWRIMEKRDVLDTKYSGGAEESVRREVCIASNKVLFPFKTNSKVASFITAKETLYFLPDALFIIQGTKIGAIKYDDIDFDTGATRFIEDLTVPTDAQVVGHTWDYVNKSGGPDMRFKDNKEHPICLYGNLTIKSNNGLNTKIMFSCLEHFTIKYE